MGETTTHEGHKIYFSGRDDRHKEGVGFLVNKNTISAVMRCRPVSSRLITIRLRVSLFNFTMVQVYAPTTTHSVEEIEDFYQQIQDVIVEAPKEVILVVQGDEMQRSVKMHKKIGKAHAAPTVTQRQMKEA